MVVGPVKIAIVGAGLAGISALRNLRDEGFEVTAFERRPAADIVGAASQPLGHIPPTQCTRYQVNRWPCPMADYPIPDEYPSQVSSPSWEAYWQSYLDWTGLGKFIEFNKTATGLRRNDMGTKWLLWFQGEDQPREFDKIVWATGRETIPKIPNIQGQTRFEGRILHSSEYTNANTFRDQKIVILGLDNSAADIAVDLTQQTRETFISYRRSTQIMPQTTREGNPLEFSTSWSTTRRKYWLSEYIPGIYAKASSRVVRKTAEAAWGPHDMAWNFEPSPGCELYTSPIRSDNLAPYMRDRKVTLVTSIKAIVSAHEVVLENDEIIEGVDAIILCTGYHNDFGMMNDALTWTTIDPKYPLPNLYQGVFPPEHPDSIACLCYPLLPESDNSTRELTAMAVAQIWSGKSRLPSQAAMWAWIHEYQPWLTYGCQIFGGGCKGRLKPHHWLRWVHDAAGTGLYEHIGWWSGAAWRLWWVDRELYNLCAHGVLTPHLYRLFDTGKRKVWSGARDAIIEANCDKGMHLATTKRDPSCRPRVSYDVEMGIRDMESAGSSQSSVQKPPAVVLSGCPVVAPVAPVQSSRR
ncbi:flavin monooxygenase-like protein [Xylariales sp. PMI_506]|nr:flavin monooxygenase-like protein [Xylariales sp. PMI_506]